MPAGSEPTRPSSGHAPAAVAAAGRRPTAGDDDVYVCRRWRRQVGARLYEWALPFGAPAAVGVGVGATVHMGGFADWAAVAGLAAAAVCMVAFNAEVRRRRG